MSPRALERFKCEVKRSGPSEKKGKEFFKDFRKLFTNAEQVDGENRGEKKKDHHDQTSLEAVFKQQNVSK